MSQSIAEMNTYLQETAEELNSLMSMDMMEMYRYLTEIGNEIPEIAAEDKVPDNFVKGCTSNVYVSGRLVDGRMEFRGSSEAYIVRGYVSILIQALSGLTPRDILDSSKNAIESFAEGTNIRATLTPSRANAFGNIYKLMCQKTEAFVG